MTAFDEAWLLVKQEPMRLEDYPITGLPGGLSRLSGVTPEELMVTAGKKPGSDLSSPFSWTEKMPGPSFGLPTKYCKAGHKMSQQEGTMCEDCYANSGTYRYPSTRDANERRYEQLMKDPVKWAQSQVSLIPSFSRMTKVGKRTVPLAAVAPDFPSIENRGGYMRWHDSGDIQSPQHLAVLADIARSTPDVNHWLPIHEPSMLRQFLAQDGKIPDNLTIRLSAPDKFQRLKEEDKNFNHPNIKYSSGGRKQLFGSLEENEYQCPGNCGEHDCNACWDRNVESVNYKLKRGSRAMASETARDMVLNNPRLRNRAIKELMGTEGGFKNFTSTEEGKAFIDRLLNGS